METAEARARQFFTHILPADGWYVLAVFSANGDGRRVIKHQVYENAVLLARAAVQASDAGYDVYHACATFAQRRPTGIRKQDNVYAIKSVWADLDCGEGKGYATQRDAAQDLARGCKTLGIPFPTLVSSGRGLHAYWVFTDAIYGIDATKRAAELMKAALQHVGVRIDPARTGDTASVLRPVGTMWRKETPARPVQVVRYMEPVDTQQFLQTLQKFVTPTQPKVKLPEEFAATATYPPANPKKVLAQCATLRHVAARRGNIPEPLWYAAIGTMSYTEKGYKVGHYISNGYPGYTYEETQARMERWQDTCSGPATCAKFRSLSPETCAGCTHAVTSPIQLGYDAVQAPEEPASSLADERTRQIELDETLCKRLPDDLLYWPQLSNQYRLVENTLQARIKTKDAEGNLKEAWISLVDTWLYPYRTRKNSDGERTVEFYVRRLYGTGKARRAKWEVISIEGAAIADITALIRALGMYGIYEVNSTERMGRPMLKQYIRDAVRAMEATRGEIDEFNKLGWVAGEEGFIVGDTIITEGTTYPAILAPDALPTTVVEGLRPHGSLQQWVKTVDAVYNRRGAEAYQFVIASAFACPLVKLANIPDFHGIPIALSGAGANGKTTVAQVACSVYGDPLSLYAGGGDTQATTNALLTMVGKVRHLPYLFDEVTGRKGEDLQTILYAISNGRPKLRLRKDGQFQPTSRMSWDTITYLTSNDRLLDVLQTGDARVVDATQVRVFEVHMHSHLANALFADVNAHDIQNILANHYGHAGIEYLKWLTANKAKARKIVEQFRRKLLPKEALSADHMKERFYRELIALTLAGAHIAKQLGLLSFDIQNLAKWATDHVVRMRRDRADVLPGTLDLIAQFFAEHSDRIVCTPRWHPRRVPTSEIMYVADKVRRPVARIAYNPAKVYINKEVFDTYLDSKKINRSWFLELAKKEDVLLLDEAADAIRMCTRVYAYKGTDLPINGMRISVYELNPAKILEHVPLQVVEPNVKDLEERAAE